MEKIISRIFNCDIKYIYPILDGIEANVYSFIDKNGKKKAIKIFNKEKSINRGFSEIQKKSIKQENLIQNTIKTIKVLESGDFINDINGERIFYQVFDYMDSDLFTALKINRTIKQNELITIALKIILGLYSLHKENIAHRDIKLENVMINQGKGWGVKKVEKVKIIDFGSIEKIEEGIIYPKEGTIECMAPEIDDPNNQITGDMLLPADIYSLGIILFDIFYINLSKNIKKSINICKSCFVNNLLLLSSRDIIENFLKLIEEMVDDDYKKRPTIIEVLSRMTKIYLSIRQNVIDTEANDFFELSSREKIMIRNLIGEDGLFIKESDITNIRQKTIRKIESINNFNSSSKLKNNIKKLINKIYNSNIFPFENENLEELNRTEQLIFSKIEGYLLDTKSILHTYCIDKKQGFEEENIKNEEFLNSLKNTIELMENRGLNEQININYNTTEI